MKKEIQKRQEGQIEIQNNANNITQIQVFGTISPQQQIQKAVEIANAVSEVIEKKRLYIVIESKKYDKKYVMCEGWATMGALLGLFPRIVETREERTGENLKVIAKCEVWSLNGNLIARAEAECDSGEVTRKKDGTIVKKWLDSLGKPNEYVIRSMAQTRAVSKAFRIALSWIMVLAGYQATPAEEIDVGIIGKGNNRANSTTKAQKAQQSTTKQKTVEVEISDKTNKDLVAELNRLRQEKGYEDDKKFEQKFGLSVRSIALGLVPDRIIKEKIEKLKNM